MGGKSSKERVFALCIVMWFFFCRINTLDKSFHSIAFTKCHLVLTGKLALPSLSFYHITIVSDDNITNLSSMYVQPNTTRPVYRMPIGGISDPCKSLISKAFGLRKSCRRGVEMSSLLGKLTLTFLYKPETRWYKGSSILIHYRDGVRILTDSLITVMTASEDGLLFDPMMGLMSCQARHFAR